MCLCLLNLCKLGTVFLQVRILVKLAHRRILLKKHYSFYDEKKRKTVGLKSSLYFETWSPHVIFSPYTIVLSYICLTPEEAFISINLGKVGYTNELLGFSTWRVREGFTIYLIFEELSIRKKSVLWKIMFIFFWKRITWVKIKFFSIVEVVCLWAWL